MKHMILATVAIAAIAVPAFALTMHGHQHKQNVGNIACSFCKGTGRCNGPGGPGTGQFKCTFCKGSGWNGSY